MPIGTDRGEEFFDYVRVLRRAVGNVKRTDMNDRRRPSKTRWSESPREPPVTKSPLNSAASRGLSYSIAGFMVPRYFQWLGYEGRESLPATK